MNKTEFIKYIAETNEITQKETELMFDTIIDSIKNALIEGNDLKFIGFGNFEIVVKKEHFARNPKTGDKIIVPESKAVKFKVSKTLKEEINC